MNKKIKTGLLIMVVLVFSISMMAFRPFNGDGDDDGIPDQTETLAEVLGIDVDVLEAAYEAAQQKAIEQAIADGKITQEQADAMQERGMPDGRRGGFPGMAGGEYLAEALGITVEELQAAQQEAQQIMIDQALEDGEISQEEYDNFQLRQNLAPYFEQARQTAFQNAIEQALEDGVITDEQAETYLNGDLPFGKGPGGWRGHGGRMHSGDGFLPNPGSSEGS
jgi:polyhydroxyalkanoate synthesis regulator phasin